MGLSTQLIGPYDSFHTSDKIRIMCGVPSVIVNEVFRDTLQSRGAMDKVLARLFHVFYVELNSDKVQEALDAALTITATEDIINDVLNRIADHPSLTPKPPETNDNTSDQTT